MGTTLRFDKDHSVHVDEDASAVESALLQAPPGACPLVAFSIGENTVYVNASLVREFEKIQEA
jgi:hypothetical protein